MKFPDFLIIGAQRCGTTSLCHYLRQHPDIQIPECKELHFFDINHHAGPSWYRRQFTGKVAGESTPIYLFYPGVEDWVAELMPDVKLIVLLRDPVERAYSHYHHCRRNGFEALSFEAGIKLENERTGQMPGLMHHSYVARGQYVVQLQRWFKRLKREQFLIMRSDELFADEWATADNALEFLGLDPLPGELDATPQNRYEYPPMLDQTRQILQDHFESYNVQLAALLGPEFVAGWGET